MTPASPVRERYFHCERVEKNLSALSLTLTPLKHTLKKDEVVHTWHFDICCYKKGEFCVSVFVFCVSVLFSFPFWEIGIQAKIFMSAWSICFAVPTLTSSFPAHQVPRQRRAARASSSRNRKLTWHTEPRRGPKGPKVNQHAQAQPSSSVKAVFWTKWIWFLSGRLMCLVLIPPLQFHSHPLMQTVLLHAKRRESEVRHHLVLNESSHMKLAMMFMARFMAFLSKVRWPSWFMVPCLPLCQVNEQLFIEKKSPHHCEEWDSKGFVDQ